MITVGEYANSFNLDVEVILNLCKNLNINVDSSDDLLSESDVELLNEQLEGVSFSHQENDNNLNGNNGGSGNNSSGGGAGGGAGGPDNNVEIDKAALYNGINKINSLKSQLESLKSILEGITVKPPISSGLLENCKQCASSAISTANSMSDRINAVKKAIYNDDMMYELLFGVDGLAYELEYDNIGQLMIDYAKGENLSEENIGKINKYIETLNNAANKLNNGDFLLQDEDGYAYQSLDKLEQFVVGAGFSLQMFGDLTSNMQSYNSQMDDIKNENKEIDDEAKNKKVDKNGKAYSIMNEIKEGNFSYDEKTGEFYDSAGKRVVLDENEDITVKYFDKDGNEVQDGNENIDSVKYFDKKGNEVGLYAGVYDGGFVYNENNSSNINLGYYLKNGNDLKIYNTVEGILDEYFNEIDEPTISIESSSEAAEKYVANVAYAKYYDKDGNEVQDGSDNIDSVKYFDRNNCEIIVTNDGISGSITDVEGYLDVCSDLFQEKNAEYINAKSNPTNQLLGFLNGKSIDSYNAAFLNEELSKQNVDWDTYKEQQIVGGYYISDDVKDVNGNGIRLYTDDISKLSSTEKASFEKVTLGDAVKQANMEQQMSELYSSTDGTFVGSDVQKLVSELKSNAVDITDVESEYLSSKGEYTTIYDTSITVLNNYQTSKDKYNLSHDAEFIYNSKLNEEKKDNIKSELNNILSGYKFEMSGDMSGGVTSEPVLKLTDKTDLGTLYVAIANGMAEVTSDGRIYYADKDVYITVQNDGIDMQTWNEFSKVLTTGDAEELVNADQSTGFSKLLNDYKKSIFDAPELNRDDYNNLDSGLVKQKVDEFKNSAYTVMIDGELGVYADEEISKYIMNSIINGGDEFKVEGNKVSYVDPKTGRTLFVSSAGDCLEIALKNQNNSSVVSDSDSISKYTTNYDYTNQINYAYNMSGGEGVFDLVNDAKFAATLNARAVDVKTQFDVELANRYPIDASLISIPLGLFEGAKTFCYATEKSLNNSNNTPIYTVNTYSSADTLRGQVAQNIMYSSVDENNEPTNTAEFQSLLYNTTMSMADNMFNTAVFGPSAMGIGLALSSFDNSYNDAINRGINQQNAYNYALSLAILEGATEQMSWNNLVKVTGISWVDDTLKNIDIDESITKAFNNKLATLIKGENGSLLYSAAKGMSGVFSQSFSEGTEELVSSVGGRFIDNALNGDKSSQFLRYKELTKSGITDNKALEIIALENLDEDLQSVVSGMISGGVMAGGGTSLNYVSSDGQFRNALEYNFANGNYDTSLNYINEYLSTSSKGIILDTKFKSDLENAVVNQDFNSAINQILNNSSISLDIKNKVTATIINTLSSTNQIDESNAKDLLSKVEEYNKNVQENNKKIQEKIEKVREQIHSEMKSKLKEKGINPRNMSLETMIKKYPDVYKEVSNNLNKKNNENSDVIEHKDGERTSFDELDILGAMQVRLDSMGINTEGMTLDDMKTKYFDIYQEVVESFNRDNSLSNDTNNTNDGESVDLSNIDLLSSFVDGHFKISLVDDMINLEGNDIIYRFSKDNVDAILKKYEGKNLNDDIVKEQFDNDLKLIENVDIVHKGEIVDSNPETVVRTGVAGALGAGIISGIGNTNTSNDGVSIDGNSNNGNQQNTNGSNINVNVVSSNSNDSNNSTSEKVNNQNGKNIDLDKKEFIAKYLSTEVKTNFANFLKSIVNSSKRKTFNISKLNSLIESFDSFVDLYSYYLVEGISRDISLNSDTVDSSNLDVYNKLMDSIRTIFVSNNDFFEQLNKKVDSNINKMYLSMESFFNSFRETYIKNVNYLHNNLKSLNDNISVKINKIINRMKVLLDSFNNLTKNIVNNVSIKNDLDNVSEEIKNEMVHNDEIGDEDNSSKLSLADVKRFLKYDVEIKKLLIKCSTSEIGDNFKFLEKDAIQYGDLLYSCIRDIEVCVEKMCELYPKFSNDLIYVKQLFSVFYDELSKSSGNISNLKKFYNKYLSGLSNELIDLVGRDAFGYSNRSVSLKNAKTINELLHILHQTLINDNEVYSEIPLISSKNDTKENYPVYLRGLDTKIAREIYDSFSSEIDVGNTDILSINENYILLMVRDRGHSLMIEIDINKDAAIISYHIPKICNVDMVNKIKGVRKVNADSKYTNGKFEVEITDIAKEVYRLIESVPMDTDMPSVKIGNFDEIDFVEIKLDDVDDYADDFFETDEQLDDSFVIGSDVETDTNSDSLDSNMISNKQDGNVSYITDHSKINVLNNNEYFAENLGVEHEQEDNVEETLVLSKKSLSDSKVDEIFDEFRPVNLSDVKVEHEENINKNVVDNIENLGARENNKFDFNQNVNISMFKNSNELIDYLRQKSLSESNIEWDKKVLSLYLEYIKENGFKYSLGYIDIFDIGSNHDFDEIITNTFDDNGSGRNLIPNSKKRYSNRQLNEMQRSAWDFRITLNNSSNIETSKAIKYVNLLVDECQKRNIDIRMKNYWERDAIILYCHSDQLYDVVELLEDLSNENKYGYDVSSVTKEFGTRKPFTIGLNNDSYYGISMYACELEFGVSSLIISEYGSPVNTYSGYSSDFLKNAYEKLLNKYDGDSSKITVDEFYDEILKYHKKYMFGDENSTENIPLWMNRRNYQELVNSGVSFNSQQTENNATEYDFGDTNIDDNRINYNDWILDDINENDSFNVDVFLGSNNIDLDNISNDLLITKISDLNHEQREIVLSDERIVNKLKQYFLSSPKTYDFYNSLFEQINFSEIKYIFDSEFISQYFNDKYQDYKLFSSALTHFDNCNTILDVIMENDDLFNVFKERYSYFYSGLNYALDVEHLQDFISKIEKTNSFNYFNDLSINDELASDILSIGYSVETLFWIVSKLSIDKISEFYLYDARAELTIPYLKGKIDNYLMHGVKFGNNVIKNHGFFDILKSDSMLEFRERINLLEENCNDPDFIENTLRLYYEDLIQQFVLKSELFKEYDRILSDSTIDIDNEVKKLNNPLSNEINIDRYTYQKNTILTENELRLSEIVVDALFGDNIYNVWININELLRYDSYLSNDEKILSEENRKLYQLILDIDSCSLEQKVHLYNKLKNENINLSFYEDIRLSKDLAYKKINDELINPSEHSEFISDSETEKNGVLTYDLRNAEYYMLVRKLGTYYADDSARRSSGSYSLISNNNTSVFSDSGILYGYNKFDIDKVEHMFESDSFSSSFSYNRNKIDNSTTAPNRISNAKELVENDGYSEVLLRNEKIDNNEYNEMKPGFVVAIDKVDEGSLKASKKLNIPIVIIKNNSFGGNSYFGLDINKKYTQGTLSEEMRRVERIKSMKKGNNHFFSELFDDDFIGSYGVSVEELMNQTDDVDNDYADDFYEKSEDIVKEIGIISEAQSSDKVVLEDNNQSKIDDTMVEKISDNLSFSDNSNDIVSDDISSITESLSPIEKVKKLFETGDYISLSNELSFEERLKLLNDAIKTDMFVDQDNLELTNMIINNKLFISNLFSNEEIIQLFNNQSEYGNVIEFIQDILISKINNFEYDNKIKIFESIMNGEIISIKNKCSFLLSFGAFDQLSLFDSLNNHLKIDIIFPILNSSNENMILGYLKQVDLSSLDIDKLKNIINSKLSNIGKKEFYDIIKGTDLEKEFFTKISEEQIEELIHYGRKDLNTMLSNFEYEYEKIISNYKRNVTARIIDCVKDEMRGISESRLEEWIEYYLVEEIDVKLKKHLEEIQNSFDIYFRMFVNDIRNDISLEKAVAKYSENVIELINGNQSRLSCMIDDCNYEFIYNIVRRIDNYYNENNSSKFDEILENIKYSLKRVVAREGSSLDTEYHSMIEKNLNDNIRRLNDYVNDIKYELKDGEKLDIGLQFFGGKGNTVKSKLFGNIFSKSKNNGGVVSQQLGDNLFNIDDIRNGKNIVSVDSIKNVDNMSRDELNKIFSSNRYNSNQKKSAILSIYLRDMNLSFSTDSVDTIYNQLLYKLSDKNIDSVERNKVLEILRSITVNSNAKYKSIDALIDYQFKEKSKKDILDTKKRNSEFDLEDFYSSNSEKAKGAVIYFSDNQVVSMLNDKNGAGSHDVAWEDIVSSVYGIDYVRNKNGAKNLMDIGNSVLRNYMDSGIKMRLVSEGDSTPQHIVIFPNKISRNQYNLFKAYVDKYGDTLSKISHNLDDKGMIYGVDGLIYCWAANMQGHNLSDLLEYAESLVDDSIKLPSERNIVGETLEDLVSSIDVGSELSYYDDSMFYLDDVYEDNASKNGDNSYELKGDESLRSKIGIQFFGGNENELQVQSNNETKKVNNQQNDIQHKNIWDTNINDKFTYLTTYEEFMNFIKENGVDNLFIRNKQYPNDKIQCFFDRIVKNSDMCITVTDELHLISIFDSFVDGKTVFINPSFFERYQEQLKTDLKNIIIEKVNTNSPSISIPDILIDDDFVNLIVSSEKFKNTKIYISDVIGNQLTQEQIDKIKKERLYVVYDNQQISTNRVIGYHTITDLKNIKSMDFLEFPNVSEIENFVYLRDDCIIRFSGSLYKDERLFLDELKKMCDILKNHNRTYNIKIKVENRELLRQTGILSYSNLNFTIENDLYEYSKDEYLKEEAVLDNLVKPIKDSDLSPYEKYLAVYNIVKQFKPYMENNEDKAQSRYLRYILNNEYMVCVGYAKLLEELLNKIEIPVIKISAAVDISKYNDDLENVPTDIAGHARNLVKIDDDKYNIHGYYVVDSTWDNDMSDDLYLHSTTTFDRRKESRRLEKMQNEDLLFDFHNFEEFSEKINYYLKKEFNSRNKENKLYSRNENYNEVVVHSYKNVYDKILELLIKLDYSEYHALYNKYDSLIQEKLELLKNKKVDSLKEIEEVFSEFLTDYAKYIIPLSNQKVDDNIIIEAASNVKREIYNFTEEDLEIWKKATIDINKNIEMYSFPYVYDSSSERKNYLYTRSLNSDSSSTNMNDGNNLLSSDTINSLSIQERQNVENFLGKVISSVTVNEYERYELVVKTANKILKTAPEGYFKDDKRRDEFLFGIDTCSESIGYTVSELRNKFNRAKQNGDDLLNVILGDADDVKGVDVEVLKVYGLYNIVYAMNQFIENSGVKVGGGELPVDKIAAVDPAYYDGAYDQIKSILDGHLQSAEINYKKVTDDLVEIAGLVNGYIKGYDPSSTKQIDHSLKKEPSAIRKVYNDWYSRLEEFGFRIEIVENNADRKLILKGIKKYNIGQSFILTEDGYVKTLDKKEFGTDEKGNIVKVNFSDFIPKDLLRYTIISDTSDYVSTFNDTVKMLEDKGYEVIDSNLSWPGSFYRGINLSLRDSETSQIFELQFHTEESFYAKNEGTHSFYEVKRNKKFNDDNKKSPIQKVADYAQILVQSQVDVPVSAEKIGFIKDFIKSVLKNKKGIDLSRMNEIIHIINKLNREYVYGTDEYKSAMREYVKSISVDSKFSLSEFLSEYFKIDTVSSMDSRTGVVSLEIVSDIDDVASSWVEDEDLGIDEEDGYELKDGESLAGIIGTQFFGGTLNNKDSFNSQLSLFSQLVESVGNNDLFSQILDQIKNLKEIELVGFKTLDEYKSYIIDYFISTNFEGLTPKQFWLLTMDKFMLKKMIGTEALNKFILDYYEIAYGNLAETFNLLDAKSLNQIFNNPEIKEYIFGLSVDVFIKSINAFCEYSNYTWLQCDTFIEKIINMSYDELYIFMEKTNYKKINLIEKVFDSGDYESCLKLLHFIENKCLNVETLFKYPEYRLMLSDFYPSVYENEELLRMYNKQEQVKDEFENKIISLLNENLDDVLLSDGYRIANLDMHSVYVVKYELNGNIMQWEIFTENKNYINMRNAIDKNDIHKAIISKNFKLLSIQKDEFASSLILSSENGLVEGINKVRLKINGVEKQILVNYTGYSDINLSDRFSNVSSIEIIGVQSVESKNVILGDGVGMYEITYVENGILNKTYLTPTHKSLWDEDYVLKIDDYFIENNIVDATDIQIRKVDIQEIDLSSLSISKYSSSYDIFANNKYGGNQSDVRKLVIDFINGTEMNFVSSEKAKCILNLIDKYFPNSSDIDKINLVVAFEQVGCGYIAVANAFCTYMGSLENGFEIFKEKFGFDLYVLENGKKYFNVEAVAFDILCSEFIHQDIKSIINENKIKGVNGLNFVIMIKNYFNDKSIFVKASTGNYIKNKNETKINLLGKNFFASENSFKILSASNFDMELMSLGANSFISNDGSLNNTEIVGNVIEGIGGHAMIITDVADDGNLIVSSWNKKYKFISESIDKYIRQGQKSEANVWTIEFDIGE